jgi:hypothetical protein
MHISPKARSARDRRVGYFDGRRQPNGYQLGRLAPVGLVLALLLCLLGVQAVTGSPRAYAATNQFHGVNWADPNDNFVTGPIVPVGLSTSDNYATTYANATAILKGFQALGANTVRMAFNDATTSPGTKAVIWSCNGQANQQWTLNGNGTITGVQSGLCLDVTGASTADGAPADLWTCNGGSNQQWTLG